MKLEFIKDKVKQACPEIMELSFGCKTTLGTVIASSNLGFFLADLEKPLRAWTLYTGEELYHLEYFEILGHPIQLSHVLRTMGVPTQTEKNSDKTSELLGGYKHSWNYLKPLDEQSEEVINFLYDILK